MNPGQLLNPLLLVGGGALAAYLWLRSKNTAAATPAPATPTAAGLPPVPGPAPAPVSPPLPQPPSQPPPPRTPPQISVAVPPTAGEVAPLQPATIVQLTGRWGWPVPRWEGRAPVISNGFGPTSPSTRHLGVDLMFGRIASDRFPVGSPNGSKSFVMPDAWMAVSAADGVLWSAQHTPRGFTVVVDHGSVATFYTHLDVLLVPETMPPAKGTPKEQLLPIKASQPLGVIGADPLDPSRLKHLHFELWAGGPSDAVDPLPLMKTWQVFTPNDVAPFLASLRRNARRDGSDPDLVHVVEHWRTKPGHAARP